MGGERRSEDTIHEKSSRLCGDRVRNRVCPEMGLNHTIPKSVRVGGRARESGGKGRYLERGKSEWARPNPMEGVAVGPWGGVSAECPARVEKSASEKPRGSVEVLGGNGEAVSKELFRKPSRQSRRASREAKRRNIKHGTSRGIRQTNRAQRTQKRGRNNAIDRTQQNGG